MLASSKPAPASGAQVASALNVAIESAFPGSRLSIARAGTAVLSVQLHQHGLLRPLGVEELSDGTLRYLLWVAALLSPRPASLLVLNEPETSLHSDLLPPAADLIGHAATRTQVIAVTHSPILIDALRRSAPNAAAELAVAAEFLTGWPVPARPSGEPRTVEPSVARQPEWCAGH